MSNAFEVCKTCGGLGFQRKGDFADRTFPKCPVCQGLGQVYLDPANAKPSPDSPFARAASNGQSAIG